MKNIIILTFLLCLCYSQSIAQPGGMRVFAGAAFVSNGDKVINPEGTNRTGWTAGADGRLMTGGMSFLVGGRYTSVSREATEGFKLMGHDSKLNYGSLRVGLDFSIVKLGRLIRIRSKILGNMDVVFSTTGTYQEPEGYKVNDGWLRAIAGLGVDVGPIVFDLEYGFGVLNAYYQKKGSSYNTFSINAGVFF